MSEGYELEPTEATAFRALSARGNYLGDDRPDIGFSAKELCREFARPNKTSFTKLKRMARYVQSHHRKAGVRVSLGTEEMGRFSTSLSTQTLLAVDRPVEAQVAESHCTPGTA